MTPERRAELAHRFGESSHRYTWEEVTERQRTAHGQAVQRARETADALETGRTTLLGAIVDYEHGRGTDGDES